MTVTFNSALTDVFKSKTFWAAQAGLATSTLAIMSTHKSLKNLFRDTLVNSGAILVSYMFFKMSIQDHQLDGELKKNETIGSQVIESAKLSGEELIFYYWLMLVLNKTVFEDGYPQFETYAFVLAFATTTKVMITNKVLFT